MGAGGLMCALKHPSAPEKEGPHFISYSAWHAVVSWWYSAPGSPYSAEMRRVELVGVELGYQGSSSKQIEQSTSPCLPCTKHLH